MQEFLETFTYLGLALILLATGIGLPLPEDIPLLIAGYLCDQGVIDLRITIPLAMTAIVGSDCLLYWFGKRYGDRVTTLPVLRRMLKPDTLSRAASLYDRHGGKMMFVARFLPGLRAPMYFTAGLFRLGMHRLLAYDGLAALISVPLIVLVGYWFSDQLDMVRGEAKRLRIALLALSCVIVLSGVLVYLVRRRYLADDAAQRAAEENRSGGG